MAKHPAQIAAERVTAKGGSREDALKAYTDKLREMGEKPVLPD